MSGLAETEIARILDVAEDKTKYDASARKLVAQKAVLAYILKSTMDEFAEIPIKQIAEELIEGTPQVAEAAVHQDTQDAPPSGNEKMSGNGNYSGQAESLADEAVRK